jgi:hypothetical protein
VGVSVGILVFISTAVLAIYFYTRTLHVRGREGIRRARLRRCRAIADNPA